jgi:hypothetical protein
LPKGRDLLPGVPQRPDQIPYPNQS